ncbi:hypothetical protein PWP93_27915 [Paraburkholderia sp. A1RI-2L]|uniref:hypothetical protein n=1 Tax=Paraburkholderia sp. A1RI-2L TaxID=3028367 RepID=UPI003B7F1774
MIFPYACMFGCAAEVDHHMNRDRNMDTRTLAIGAGLSLDSAGFAGRTVTKKATRLYRRWRPKPAVAYPAIPCFNLVFYLSDKGFRRGRSEISMG